MQRMYCYRLIEATSVVLFLFQALRVMFSVLFGIIYDGVFEGPIGPWLVISNVLVVCSLLLPALLAKTIRTRHMSQLAFLAAAARIAMNVNDATIRYWGALVVMLAGVLYLAAILRFRQENRAAPLVLALGLYQLLIICGDTHDISLRAWWLPIQAFWAFLLLAGMRFDLSENRVDVEMESRPGAAGGMVLGGFLFLELSLLSLPNAMARWSDVAYPWVAPILLVISMLFWLPGVRRCNQRWWRSHLWARILALALLSLGVMAGYFMKSTLAIVGLLLSQASALAILIGMFEVGDVRKWSSGAALSLGMMLFLVLNFLNAFAFTYPYTLPVMREKGWLVYLMAVAAILPALWTKGLVKEEKPPHRTRWEWAPVMAFLLIALAFVWPKPYQELPETGRLRLATYNIHYGYDDDWHYTLEAIAETIRAEDCDVVALQEVDTGRLTSYGVDNAYYLSRRLKMQVAYLPTVEHLTGIALLYRGPKVAEEGRLISSLQEQTGIMHVPLSVGGNMMHAFAIWMGLSKEDTQKQISEALAFISDRTPASFGGDFNATSESAVAQSIRAAGFIDSFEALGIEPAPPTSPAIEPKERIDFIWLRGLTPAMAWVSDSLASDHRMAIVEVGFPP